MSKSSTPATSAMLLLPPSNPSPEYKTLSPSSPSFTKSPQIATATSSPGLGLSPQDEILRHSPEKPQRSRTRVSLLSRSRSSPIHNRSRLKSDYEKPITDRESWWRETIKETPGPAAYEAPELLADLERRPNTYRFKSDGRRLDPQPQIGKGAYLMPGAYEHKGMIQLLERSQTTYNFKATFRDDSDSLNFGKKDKDINVSPDAYPVEKYLTMTCDKQPSRHWIFRSNSIRFPTKQFKPKEGPPPGNYEYTAPTSAHSVSSSFKSKTPRFVTSHKKTPGPGTYDRVFQTPMPKTILNMGRQQGVFFSSAFQV